VGRTLTEKIVRSHALGLPSDSRVRTGDIVRIRPAHLLTHDNTSAVIGKFQSWGGTRVRDPRQPVLVLDHDIQNESQSNLAQYARIEAFAREQGLTFFPKGQGIGHQVMVEEGFVLPGAFVVAADSHANMYGALAALGTPLARTDAAAIWATGESWWEIPEVVRVELRGRLHEQSTGKDVIMALTGAARHDEVLNRVVEFMGDGVVHLAMSQRLTISNMTTEWGALAGIFPADDVLFDFLRDRARVMRERGDASPRLTDAPIEEMKRSAIAADDDAVYAAEITIDLEQVSQLVAGPNDVKAVRPLAEVARDRIPVNKAYILSCVNARLEDLEEAASVLRGQRVKEGVELYVAAASADVEREARQRGVWQSMLDAGAIPLPSGCGPCIGLGKGTLGPGETGISATNRNFPGRMGDRSAQCYLASPAVVAASALAGFITGPRVEAGRSPAVQIRWMEKEERGRARNVASTRPHDVASNGAPEIAGEIVFLPKDDLNTDGIYPAELTYRDHVSAEEMGAAAFRNYDPAFTSIARPGDLLVGGRNFGTGSSREQAATALRAFGIAIIIAASCSQTYKRNALNNGIPIVECEELSSHLAARFASNAGQRTIRTGLHAKVDLGRGEIRAGEKVYAFAPFSEIAFRLLAAQGLGNLVREALRTQGPG
jgi:homoaconitate hydratase